ncbi:MAG: hypothetical protein AB7E72_05855 [Lysobacterales bacterium]
MKKLVLLVIVLWQRNARMTIRGCASWLLLVWAATAHAQDDCLARLERAFDTRGSGPVDDGMHQNVYLAYLADGERYCVNGAARVLDNSIVEIYLQYEDGSMGAMEPKFYNAARQVPGIDNGISELIYNADGEQFKVVFIDALNPE